MLSIMFILEGTPKGYLEKGKVDIPNLNNKYFKKIFNTPTGPKRQKLIKNHIKIQNRVKQMPSSFR